MSVRNNFKKAVLRHVRDSYPENMPLCMPNNSTKEFIELPEWGRIFIQHANGRQVAHAGKGSRRYNRTGTIILRFLLEKNKGDKRADELAKIWEDAFDGRRISGIDSTFTEVRSREAGEDNDGRYNILLCEAVFEYREIK